MRMREKGEVTHESAFLYILSPLRISKPNGHSPPVPARPPPVGALSAPACAFCWNGLRIPATWWWARMRIGAGFRIRSGRAAGNSLSVAMVQLSSTSYLIMQSSCPHYSAKKLYDTWFFFLVTCPSFFFWATHAHLFFLSSARLHLFFCCLGHCFSLVL